MSKRHKRKMEKDLEKLLNPGYSIIISKSNHYKVYDPNGKMIVVLAYTPSDHRGYHNSLARLRRAGAIQ